MKPRRSRDENSGRREIGTSAIESSFLFVHSLPFESLRSNLYPCSDVQEPSYLPESLRHHRAVADGHVRHRGLYDISIRGTTGPRAFSACRGVAGNPHQKLPCPHDANAGGSGRCVSSIHQRTGRARKHSGLVPPRQPPPEERVLDERAGYEAARPGAPYECAIGCIRQYRVRGIRTAVDHDMRHSTTCLRSRSGKRLTTDVVTRRHSSPFLVLRTPQDHPAVHRREKMSFLS